MNILPIRNKRITEIDPLTYSICFKALEAGSTIKLNRIGTPTLIELEYSFDNSTWNAYSWDEPDELNTTMQDGLAITLNNLNDKVYFRNQSSTFSTGALNYYQFEMTGVFEVSRKYNFFI